LSDREEEEGLKNTYSVEGLISNFTSFEIEIEQKNRTTSYPSWTW